MLAENQSKEKNKPHPKNQYKLSPTVTFLEDVQKPGKCAWGAALWIKWPQTYWKPKAEVLLSPPHANFPLPSGPSFLKYFPSEAEFSYMSAPVQPQGKLMKTI